MTGKRIWVEVNRQNLLDNITTLKKVISGDNPRFMAVVKSNAYGHGLKEVVSVIKNDIDWFGVNSLDEALKIQQESDKPVLILGFTSVEDLPTVFESGIRQSVFSLDYLQQVVQVTKGLKLSPVIDLKIETGTNRLGIALEDLPEAVSLIKSSNLMLEGIYSHLADAENPENQFTLDQIDKLQEAVRLIKNLGIEPQIEHIGASAASLVQPSGRLGLTRFGISLYGLWPDREIEKVVNFQLRPALSWKTMVAQVKKVKSGETIGYGRTFKAIKDMKIAVLPVGYYEGYSRALSNKEVVLIGGQKAPIVGRICMNMTMVDISGVSAQAGDEVVLIGKQGKEEITAEMMAEWTDTINYEIVARINPELPRVLV